MFIILSMVHRQFKLFQYSNNNNLKRINTEIELIDFVGDLEVKKEGNSRRENDQDHSLMLAEFIDGDSICRKVSSRGQQGNY